MSKTPGFFISAVAIAICVFSVSTSINARASDFLVPDGIAHRAGLKVEWTSQLQVGGPDSMVDWYLQINENESTTFYTLESGPLREVVSNRQLNNQGEPFGMEGAKEEIDFRAEILQARYDARGVKDIEIKQSSYSLPKSVLYTLGSNGMVSAIDADTGIHYWDRVIDSSSRVVGLGASNDHVGVVIGSKVYCLKASDGRVLWSRHTKYTTGASPAVSDTHIVVPLANGRLQAFEIATEGTGTVSYFANGFASARPLVTPTGIAWVTENGQMNFANPKTSTAVNFRLRASDSMVSSPTGKGDMLFVTSLDGYVYGVNRVSGRLIWDVTTGTSISTSPVPIGDALFVVSDSAQLFKLDARTGNYAKGWDSPIPRVKKFLGATKEAVFALDGFDKLVVIDQKSAKITSSIPVGEIDRVLTNYQSDRIYVASAQGLVQCVRSISHPRPIFHSSDFDTSEMDQGKPKKKVEDEDPFGDAASDDEAEEADPFDDGSNPFGADSETPAGDEGDPFGSAGDDDDDNPFN